VTGHAVVEAVGHPVVAAMTGEAGAAAGAIAAKVSVE
jgi:hypothetical protein